MTGGHFSYDIDNRFCKYKNLKCTNQRRLFNSLKNMVSNVIFLKSYKSVGKEIYLSLSKKNYIKLIKDDYNLILKIKHIEKLPLFLA